MELQYKISDYLIKSAKTLFAQAEFEDFEEVVPPSFRSEINTYIYHSVAENTLFDGNPTLTLFLLKRVRNKYYKPGEDIVSQGEKGEEIYFIANGK